MILLHSLNKIMEYTSNRKTVCGVEKIVFCIIYNYSKTQVFHIQQHYCAAECNENNKGKQHTSFLSSFFI